jgi:membrane-associated PAP2 superfamily phosphatase
MLAATLGFGLLFGWAQLVRGAHFPSHTMWSAWLCWTIGAIAARWLAAPPASIADVGQPAALPAR